MNAEPFLPTKEILEAQLEHTKNNYILGLAGYALLSSEKSQPVLNTLLASFGGYFITFDQVTALLSQPRDRHIALTEFLKMHMRTLIKESFELIKDYCTATDQYGALKSQSWYEFARMIRNFLSHNCRFEFNKYDRMRLPVVWKAKAITIEMDRCAPDLTFFGEVETWELFQEFEAFVKERLK